MTESYHVILSKIKFEFYPILYQYTSAPSQGTEPTLESQDQFENFTAISEFLVQVSVSEL